jgi:putative DNA-invertase from lambdoid prophage Rac
MTNFLYIRVSTLDQDTAAQENALNKYAVTHNITDIEVISEYNSTKKSRPGLTKLLHKQLKENDTIYVTELSRIGRSMKDLLDIAEFITSKNATLHSVNENLILNQTTSAGTRFYFHMLSAMSNMERNLISDRTKVALHYKKLQGIKLGRPKNLPNKALLLMKDQILGDRAKGLSISRLAKNHGVSWTTMDRFLSGAK